MADQGGSDVAALRKQPPLTERDALCGQGAEQSWDMRPRQDPEL